MFRDNLVNSFKHDGRFIKCGRNFLKLDENDNVLYLEYNKKFLILPLEKVWEDVSKYYHPEIVAQKDVDEADRKNKSFHQSERECDEHNLSVKKTYRQSIIQW